MSHRFHPQQAGDTEDSDAVHLVAVPRSVRDARDHVGTCLAKWDLAEYADSAVLVTSEYATNAVTATGGTGDAVPLFGVQLRRTATHLLIEVGDVSPDRPRPRSAGTADESGRGLALAAAMADHTGSYATPTGKVVWAAWALDDLGH